MLSEKPVAHDFRDVRRVADLAPPSGLKTKVGFTFRYSPAVRYLQAPDRQRRLGTPYIYNAYEQNSQWLNPQSPLRSGERAGDRPLQVASLEGYGAPVIDIGHWFMGCDLTAVVGVMRNFVPERMILDTGTDGPGQHRRRRHLHRRVRQRRDLLGPDQLRHRRQLPGHRGAGVRQRGRGDRPAGRGVRHLRDAEGGQAGRRRVPRGGGAAELLPGRRQPARVLADPVLREPGAPTSPARSSARSTATRATSTTACGCRRSSTPSRSRTTSAAGSACRWNAVP